MSTPAERAAELAAEMKAAAAAKKAAKPPAAVPTGPQTFDSSHAGHVAMAQAADRFVTSSILSRHSPVAKQAAERARAEYAAARRTHGFVEGIEGPCEGSGCPTTHLEGKAFCGGGSCRSGKQIGQGTRKTTDVSGHQGGGGFRATTSEKAGPSAKGDLGDLVYDQENLLGKKPKD